MDAVGWWWWRSVGCLKKIHLAHPQSDADAMGRGTYVVRKTVSERRVAFCTHESYCTTYDVRRTYPRAMVGVRPSDLNKERRQREGRRKADRL